MRLQRAYLGGAVAHLLHLLLKLLELRVELLYFLFNALHPPIGLVLSKAEQDAM
jgi:hypothetical protein